MIAILQIEDWMQQLDFTKSAFLCRLVIAKFVMHIDKNAGDVLALSTHISMSNIT